MLNKPVIRVYTKTDLEAKINIPESDNVLKISSVSKDGFDILLNKVKSFLKV
ncbi:hypothetical protein HOF65_07370 [bacterium]|nr:hypothetical protein [bacterium]MBT5491560.1 hypothetical protein [bacterium]MBT6779249.1 hypothetical protein [bacterium]